MREFKFRAFDPEARKMIYKPETLRRVLYYEKDNGFHMGRVKSKTNGDWVSFPIMQWTGLFDKTGNHIWEGDLIKSINITMYGGVREIKWHDQICAWVGEWELVKPILLYDFVNPEVIGNIYEDKHLLK